MRVVTAVENDYGRPDGILCFLAGGITNCPDWQSDVIDCLSEIPDLDRLVLLNPRRKDFPIHDPNASYEQIRWEFDRLQVMDLFSMLFCGGESDQPICMYELGRNLLAMHIRFHQDWKQRLIISCDSAYRRKNDVLIQTGLVCGEGLAPVLCFKDYDEMIRSHAKCIADAYFLALE